MNKMKIEERYLVYPGRITYQQSLGVTIIPLKDLIKRLLIKFHAVMSLKGRGCKRMIYLSQFEPI